MSMLSPRSGIKSALYTLHTHTLRVSALSVCVCVCVCVWVGGWVGVPLKALFKSPVQSTGRAIVVTLASALALALAFPSRHF